MEEEPTDHDDDGILLDTIITDSIMASFYAYKDGDFEIVTVWKDKKVNPRFELMMDLPFTYCANEWFRYVEAMKAED